MKSLTIAKNTLLTSLASFALLLAVFTPVTVSAATCSGSGCNGKDPAATGCSGNAYIAKRTQFRSTATGQPISNLYMDVYYSRTCGTNWVRITSNPYCGNAHKEITVAKSGGFAEKEDDTTCGASYSMQVYAPGSTPVQAWANLKDTAGKYRAYTPDVLVY